MTWNFYVGFLCCAFGVLMLLLCTLEDSSIEYLLEDSLPSTVPVSKPSQFASDLLAISENMNQGDKGDSFIKVGDICRKLLKHIKDFHLEGFENDQLIEEVVDSLVELKNNHKEAIKRIIAAESTYTEAVKFLKLRRRLENILRDFDLLNDAELKLFKNMAYASYNKKTVSAQSAAISRFLMRIQQILKRKHDPIIPRVSSSFIKRRNLAILNMVRFKEEGIKFDPTIELLVDRTFQHDEMSLHFLEKTLKMLGPPPQYPLDQVD